MKIQRKGQDGFTMIELIVVMAIVAIMAAVALPRFVDLQTEARQASLNAVFGGFQAAVQLVHAKWLADGSSPTSIMMEGSTVFVSTTGWPTIDAANTTQDQAGKLYGLIMGGPLPSQFTGTETQAAGAGTGTYTQTGSGDTIVYDSSGGMVTCANC